MTHSWWYNGLRALPHAFLVWYAFRWLAGIHSLLAAGVWSVAATNTWMLWALRFRRELLRSVCQWPIGVRYLRWLCQVAGEQMPAEHLLRQGGNPLLLNNEQEFAHAMIMAKSYVQGHDATIESILRRIQTQLTLRKHQTLTRPNGPLATFLLVGKQGIGKCYLARVIASLLYRQGAIFRVCCEPIHNEWLTGSGPHDSNLCESLRREPFQLLLLENVDQLPESQLNYLQSILQYGRIQSRADRRWIDLQSTVVVMTVARSDSALHSIARRELTETAWHAKACEVLTMETHLPRSFLHQLHELHYCPPLSDGDQGRVVAQAIRDECAAHGVELVFIAPEVVAAEAVILNEGAGFGDLIANVRRRLKEPLLAAMTDGRNKLSLNVTDPSPSTNPPKEEP